jgi:hypothetical protein
MSTITLAQLRKAKASKSQTELFEQVFGDSVSFDDENFFVPYAQKFDFRWVARNLLSAPARKTFNEQYALARKTFDEQIAPARKTFDEQIALARKTFYEQTALARKTFDKQTALAWKTFDEQIAPARKTFNEQTAIIFARAYLSMEEE